jgi:hypothetical protein
MSNLEMENLLIGFYRDGLPTPTGYTLEDVLSWDDAQWEYCHTFIQWTFPLTEPSKFNPDAPLLTPDLIKDFIETPEIMDNVGKLLQRAKKFFGIGSRTKPHWFEEGNHNMLRMTRIITFLVLIEQVNDAEYLYQWLDWMDYLYPEIVSDLTWDFWQKAFWGRAFFPDME